eukprot:5102897-Pyramimonas_sp.AAC.1
MNYVTRMSRVLRMLCVANGGVLGMFLIVTTVVAVTQVRHNDTRETPQSVDGLNINDADIEIDCEVDGAIDSGIGSEGGSKVDRDTDSEVD